MFGPMVSPDHSATRRSLPAPRDARLAVACWDLRRSAGVWSTSSWPELLDTDARFYPVREEANEIVKSLTRSNTPVSFDRIMATKNDACAATAVRRTTVGDRG